MTNVDDFLAHHGVLGMHWGKHLPGKGLNVSSDQHKRNTQIYGKRGAARINRDVGRGDSISVARGTAKAKRDKILDTNKYARQGGKAVGAIAGIAAANLAISGLGKLAQSSAGHAFVAKHLGSGTAGQLRQASIFLNQPGPRLAISAGVAYATQLFAGDLTVRTRNRIHGLPANARR